MTRVATLLGLSLVLCACTRDSQTPPAREGGVPTARDAAQDADASARPDARINDKADASSLDGSGGAGGASPAGSGGESGSSGESGGGMGGSCEPVAELCDGADNDCDGTPDQTFPLRNAVCAEDGNHGTARRLGPCRGTGTLSCNAIGTGYLCNINVPGAAPIDEQCNDIDDDCDGHIDEPFDADGFSGVRDALVGPLVVNGQSVVMYRYEASRPDATPAGSGGFVTTRACSRASRLPWSMVSQGEAAAACNAAGMRLCRTTRSGMAVIDSDEWGRYCEGAPNFQFPYSNAYVGTNCNGSDYDPLPGGVNEDQPTRTGAMASCSSYDLAQDLSGNLWEWTDDLRSVAGETMATLRGGAYDNHPPGLTCDMDRRTARLDYRAPNVGFRCCGLTCATGQSECSGACVDLATSALHCGACGTNCAAGSVCSNGYCCPTGTRACGDVCVPNADPCP